MIMLMNIPSSRVRILENAVLIKIDAIYGVREYAVTVTISLNLPLPVIKLARP